jgi:hypothetical protein
MISSWPVENETRLRFFFAVRELTDDEFERFMEGNGLPSGVGRDPGGTVNCVYQPPRGQEHTVVAVRDGVGEYHLVVVPTASQAGMWRWRGQGLNAEGEPQVSTQDFLFNATRSF